MLSGRIAKIDIAGEHTTMKPVGQPPNQHSVPTSNNLATQITHDTRSRLVRLAYRFVWNREDAEDAVQDALARSLEHGHELKTKDKWLSWLSSIVVHTCHELGRKRKTRDQHTARLQLAAESHSIDSCDKLSVEHDAVRRRLERLPGRQREVIVLRHLELMSYEQIADILDLSPSTVRVHARNGLESLRTMMQDEQSKDLT